MEALSIPPDLVDRQIGLFQNPPPFMTLARPAAIGDGIQRLSPKDKPTLMAFYEKARAAGRLSKFVPASGAATRMFQSLLRLFREGHTRKETLQAKAAAGDSEALSALLLMDSLPKVAFYGELNDCLRAQGKDLKALLAQGDYAPVWDCLLFEAGLGYGGRSKGLIHFHGHAAGARTALEEHLWEALGTVKDAQGICRIHFTVSPEHRADYGKAVEKLLPAFGPGTRFQIDFSEQEKCQQTLAVDLENRPFRDAEGRLVFRPAGHGALIGNLDRLGADIVFIKNIDNVVIEKLLEPTLEWKKLLAGYLLSVQSEVFSLLDRLEKEPGAAAEALAFIEDRWGAAAPAKGLAPAEQKKWINRFLDRPLRVCGVVPNTGEPGGGPFWVEGRGGEESLQIIEGAQVDPSSEAQKAIFSRSTHFNPVDLVCAVSDRRGLPYNLKSYVDETAVFISRKSHLGRDLKALELPGLWNGAMAGWLTLFVEVPLETFNPVKTVFDLLKPAHQA